jgi:hypothetical protein
VSVHKTAWALVLSGLLAVTSTGCGSVTLPEPPEAGPLTVDDWKDLDPSEKYDPATFDRLKRHDPKLKSEEAWEQFMRKVVIPERKVDMPDSIPKRQ